MNLPPWFLPKLQSCSLGQRAKWPEAEFAMQYPQEAHGLDYPDHAQRQKAPVPMAFPFPDSDSLFSGKPALSPRLPGQSMKWKFFQPEPDRQAEAKGCKPWPRNLASIAKSPCASSAARPRSWPQNQLALEADFSFYERIQRQKDK